MGALLYISGHNGMRKLEELRRRRGITGLLGCPSDTKDPDDWDWDNWDNWPQEDKDMFPIDEEMNLKEDLWFGALGRETQDPDTWHDNADYKWIEENAITTCETDVPGLEEVATEIGYVYLYKGKYLAQADNGGLQIDHPCPEEVVQYFLDHYGERIYESMNESVSFIDKWHDTLELIPDCENVWFIADGKIYIGLYEPEQKIFCMADGLGVPLAQVRQWKYITEKEVAGYPKEKQIIAVDVPDFPCPVTGIFSDHLTDEETGDEFSGVVLDEEYAFCEGGCDSVKWENVFAWYPLPEEPLNVIDVDADVDLSGFTFEFDKQDSNEGDIFDTMEGVKRNGNSEAENATAQQDIFTIMDVSGNNMNSIEDALDASKNESVVEEDIKAEPGHILTPDEVKAAGQEAIANGETLEEEPVEAPTEGGSAIAASNPEEKEEEEEDLVKVESKKSEGERLTESEDDSLFDEKVKDWYVAEYPTDDMGADIDPEISFMDVFHALDTYEDFYDTIGVGDSIIRERIFTELAKRMGVDYDYIYDQWLRAADKAAERSVDWSRVDPEWIEELYRKGQNTVEERDTALENIRKAREGKGIYEAVNKKNPHVREAKVFYEFPGSYRPWSGAVDTWDVIEANGAMDDLENFLDEAYPDGIGETELNDLLWFDSDYVYEALGIRNPDAEDEEEEEEDYDSEEEGDGYEDGAILVTSPTEYKGYEINHWKDRENANDDWFTVTSDGRFISVVKDEEDGKRYIDGLKESKSALKAHKLKESIRGNTKKFIENVEKWLDGFGDEIWEDLRLNIQYLQQYTRYGFLQEAIREYVEGGSLDCYYDDVRKTLNELYENTPEEVEKWKNYPTDKLWERYINVMIIYIPKAYKKHTGKSLDMKEDPESEYNQKLKAKYGERKLSVGEYLYERGLTRAERHNRDMERIFNKHREIINNQKAFLKGKGLSDDEVDALDRRTGLGADAIGDKIRSMGCWDEFWTQNKKMSEHLEHLSDEMYGKWVKLKRKLDPEYLADYCIEALPPYEAELVIGYLADMNGIENGDLNDY